MLLYCAQREDWWFLFLLGWEFALGQAVPSPGGAWDPPLSARFAFGCSLETPFDGVVSWVVSRIGEFDGGSGLGGFGTPFSGA